MKRPHQSSRNYLDDSGLNTKIAIAVGALVLSGHPALAFILAAGAYHWKRKRSM